MIMRWGRSIVVSAAIAAAVMSANSAEGCELLRRMFGGGTYSTYYVPMTAAPVTSACSMCPAPTVSYYSSMPSVVGSVGTGVSSTSCYTTYYVPQTYYRPVVQNVALTAYRPVATYMPLTGRVNITYRPVTIVQPQVSYVAQTTYRIECAPTACPSAPIAVGASGCVGCTSAPSSTLVPSGTSELSPIPSSGTSGWGNSSSGATLVPQSGTGVSRQDPAGDVAPSLQNQRSVPPIDRTVPPANSSLDSTGAERNTSGSGTGASSSSRPWSSIMSVPPERTTFRPQIPPIGWQTDSAAQVMLASRQAETVVAARPAISPDGWEAAE